MATPSQLLAALAALALLQLGAAELVTGTYDFMGRGIFYQKYDPKPGQGTPTVLFLHGAAFKSDTWVNLGTLKLVAQEGYRAVAIDIPGWGKTPRLMSLTDDVRAAFVMEAINFATEGAKSKVILVTPSMSGRWAVPFLDQHGTTLDGWVGIAPVGVQMWNGGPPASVRSKVKLLAVYGSLDPMMRDVDELTGAFTDSTKVIIRDAPHACYIPKPQEFHQALIPFIKRVLGPGYPSSSV